jgi:hypothetical protein
MQKDSPKIPTDPMHIISTFGVVHQSFLLENGEKTPQKAQKKEPRLISAGEENSRTLVIRCESRPGPHKESDPLGITFVHSPLSPYLTSCLKQNSAPISEFL